MSLIYLDNSATSYPKAPGVADEVSRSILSIGTSGRAVYDEALKGSRVLYQCRKNLAELFKVPDSSQIILNSGATESLNTVIKGLVKKDMAVLTSGAEHNSVMRPLMSLSEHRNVNVLRFHMRKDGTPDLESYMSCLNKTPCLVVLCHSSNVSGAIYPVREMIAEAHKRGIPVCIDGAQSAGHEQVDLIKWDVDFFCFSGHKGLLGPAGTGGFYIKKGIEIDPLAEGGTGSKSEEEFQPRFLPDRYESGTRNIPGMAGLAASTAFILEKGIESIKSREQSLRDRLLHGLKQIPGIVITGPEKERNSVISFFHDTMDLSDLAEGLIEKGIAMRMGLHCSPSAHKSIGTYEQGGAIRFSPGYFSTEKEMDRAVSIVRKLCNGR